MQYWGYIFIKDYSQAVEMTHWLRVRATFPNDPSLVPGTLFGLLIGFNTFFWHVACAHVQVHTGREGGREGEEREGERGWKGGREGMEGREGENIERRLFIIKNSKLIRYSIFYLPTLGISLGFVVLAFCLFSTLSVEPELTTK